ncbi:polyamine ABC transporter substrate-binding protein [Spartinivicinus poritis]|uniref:Spermidine/putrescine ABC transporter substrate-binding protein n=1 Tax=Spartinivicinus poritis TaxID=2994640 RepID=A0ABT5UCV1_9GAMM|nr:spermidine/putrescine ABC transporter substrate-binding protein [Spartinivicinus sp. A2-2]MDE1464147.1 spermidine/putrescine ABC transporter substrate-binding protein [Spartinivicinus sp. A2-2]
MFFLKKFTSCSNQTETSNKPVMHRLLGPLLFLLCATTTWAKEPLIVFTWPDYISPSLVQKFEKQWNTKVKLVYYESDQDRDNHLTKVEGKGYDVMIASNIALPMYINLGWVAPMDKAKVPNIKNYDSRYLTSANPVFPKYAVVPYFWGTTGIAYRKDLVNQRIDSWQQFFQPDPSYAGKILMIDDAREAITQAFISLGYNQDDYGNKQALRKVEDLLLSQKSAVKDYTYLTTEKESSRLVSGDVVMSYAYNGDGVLLKTYHPQIEFVVPKEGCILWTDYLVVLAKSTKQSLAYDFVNFFSNASSAAKSATDMHFASPNLAAEKLLPADFLADSTIYPDPNSLESCRYLSQLPARVYKKWNHLFSKVRH